MKEMKRNERNFAVAEQKSQISNLKSQIFFVPLRPIRNKNFIFLDL
jgi:hypothetical protein